MDVPPLNPVSGHLKKTAWEETLSSQVLPQKILTSVGTTVHALVQKWSCPLGETECDVCAGGRDALRDAVASLSFSIFSAFSCVTTKD